MTDAAESAMGGSGVAVMDGLRLQLEALGLGGNEARCVLALLQLGSATATEVSRVSGVPRTAIYRLLEGLESKLLVEPVSSDGAGARSTVWASPGLEELLARLRAAQRVRLNEAEALIEQLGSTLAATLPAHSPTPPLPYLRLVQEAAQNRLMYERLLGEAESEVLVFNKAPQSWAPGHLNRAVFAALERGVHARAIYEAGALYAPENEGFRREHQTYMAAGVEAVVVDKLPLKLAVFDRKTVLSAAVEGSGDSAGYPTSVLIEHPDYAEALTATFEHYWAQGLPYRSIDEPTLPPER